MKVLSVARDSGEKALWAEQYVLSFFVSCFFLLILFYFIYIYMVTVFNQFFIKIIKGKAEFVWSE